MKNCMKVNNNGLKQLVKKRQFVDTSLSDNYNDTSADDFLKFFGTVYKHDNLVKNNTLFWWEFDDRIYT